MNTVTRIFSFGVLLVTLFSFHAQAQTQLPPAPYQPVQASGAQTKFFGLGGTVPVIDVKSILQAVKTYKTLKDQYMKVKSKYELAMKMSRYISNMQDRYKTISRKFHNIRPGNVFDQIESIADTANGEISDTQDFNVLSDTLFNKTSVKYIPPEQVQPTPAPGTEDPAEKQRKTSTKANLGLQKDAWKRGLVALASTSHSLKADKPKTDNLEADSLSGSEGLNSQIAVLNKINAVMLSNLKMQQDTQKLLSALVAQQNATLKAQYDANAAYENIMNEAKAAMEQVNSDMDKGADNYMEYMRTHVHYH